MRQDRESPIMVVDDDPDLCRLLARWFEHHKYRAETFRDGETCLAGLARSLPDCICLDLHLPGLSGLETLQRIKTHHPRLPVIVLTADSTVETVVSAMQAGAYDYLVKPVDRTKLINTVRLAVEHHHMSTRLVQLEREVEGSGYGDLIGKSPVMKDLFRQLDRVAPSDITVLIHGESGVGKELVAGALHEQSGRREFSFIPVNCAAIPENLEESEFFGHEKGSFTGATKRRLGYIEQAHRGTLFLDEIGELSLSLQAKLLRVLQERKFQRVGSSGEKESDFRLLAATHRDLEEEVKKGRFREDLFFRVAVFELEVPPLRDRGEDIQLLADKFLDELAERHETQRPTLTRNTRRLLSLYPWPGNVRELQNAMERARVVNRDGRICTRDLPPRIRTNVDGSRWLELACSEEEEALRDHTPAALPPEVELSTPTILKTIESSQNGQSVKTLEEIERDAIALALKRTGGNLSEVVRQLDIGRTTLYRKLKRYELR